VEFQSAFTTVLKEGGISCKNPRAVYCVATPLPLVTAWQRGASTNHGTQL